MSIDFEHVTVNAGGREVVRDVAFTVEVGEVVGLVGPNGSGKSSLLRCAYGVGTTSRGRVRVGGDDVTTLRRPALARRLAVVPQDHTLEFDLTVAEVVALGRIAHRGRWARSGDDRRAVVAALAMVEVAHLARRPFPTLSGGERQLVLVARALAQDANHLVLDEPTNHLDIRHQVTVLGLLRRPDRAVLAALHDLNLAAAHCDRVVVLDAGRIAAMGTPREVLDPQLVRAVYGVEATATCHSDLHQLLFHPATPNQPTPPRENPHEDPLRSDHALVSSRSSGRILRQ